MPSFETSPLGKWLAGANVALEKFATRTTEAVAASSSARSAAETTVRDTRSAVEALENSTATIVSSGARVQEVGDRVADSARRLADEVEGSEKRTKESLDRQRQHVATRFDDLVQLAREGRNEWDAELELQLEAVQAGVQSLDDFLAKFGEGVVRLDGEVTTVRELLQDVDYRAAEERLQTLLAGLRGGRVEIEEVLGFLDEAVPKLAGTFLQLVRDFLDGKVTLERVGDEVRRLQKLFGPETGLTDLAESLLQRLQDAGRDGRL
jgi:hypothetical protein